MKRRDFTRMLPIAAAGSIVAGNANAHGHCEETKAAAFEDLCWEAVVEGAKSLDPNAKFKSRRKCIAKYKKHNGGTWYDLFKVRFREDKAQGLDPCREWDGSHFSAYYFRCCQRAGLKAAVGADEITAITAKEFEAAFTSVNKLLNTYNSKANVVKIVAHMCT